MRVVYDKEEIRDDDTTSQAGNAVADRDSSFDSTETPFGSGDPIARTSETVRKGKRVFSKLGEECGQREMATTARCWGISFRKWVMFSTATVSRRCHTP